MFASKIELQPLEADTDAQLHKKRVISVRKEAEFASRVLQQKCPRWNEDTLQTSCQGDVEEFQELIKVAQKTVVTTQVQRYALKIQTMTRSKVENMPKPDLEQTAAQSTDAAQSPGAMLQISSRQQTSLRERKRA